jgi:PncC family amidohydrolase
VTTRAGIVVTGTEVLTGRVADRNGPWLADRLEELGVELAQVAIVGDRREDLLAVLRFMAAQGYELVLTSGGLGPTADDLTAEVVGEVQGRAMVWDGALQERIEAIIARFGARWRGVDMEAMRTGARKQATIPEGATVLEPVGTAPGLIVLPTEAPVRAHAGRTVERGTRGTAGSAPASRPAVGAVPATDVTVRRGPTVVVLPGPPRELQPMWEQSVTAELAPGGALSAALAGATSYRRRTLRLFGIPESEIAETLRVAEREGVDLERLEITTCLKRGEVEVVTRYEPPEQEVYDALVALVRTRHGEALFSEDGSTVDEQVAALLVGTGMGAGGECLPGPVGTGMGAGGECLPGPVGTGMGAGGECLPGPVGTGMLAGTGTRAKGACHPASVGSECTPAQVDEAGSPRTIATAESCTGGLLVARLTELPGASEYVRGAIVAYANDVKVAQAGVPIELIERHGAVSPEVAQALAEGARERLGADIGVGVTGIAGPGGGSPEKPVGTVCLSAVGVGEPLTRTVTLPGGRADVRDRACTVALHLVRRLLSRVPNG